MEQKETSSAAGGCKIGTRFEARLDCVPAAMAYLAEEMRRAGAAPDALLRAELILEELFRNSVLHGYRGGSAQPVWLAADADGFCYQDAAPAFDPLADAPAGVAPDPALAIEDQPVGGAGLLLIRQLASAVHYARRDGRNQLRIDVAPQAGAVRTW